MSTTGTGPGAIGPANRLARGSSQRAALLAGVVAVGLVVAVLVAHAVRGSGKAASPAASGSSMKAAPASSGSMGAMPSAPAMSAPGSAIGSGTVMTVRGATLPAMQTSGAMPVAMAMVPLGQADWEGMTIQARTSAPATFILLNGSSQQIVRPTTKDSFHLMVTLSDTSTGYAIPYSSVWATIKKAGKVVVDEQLWPMISRYMGPHFGDNVALPTAGTYQLSLLISPPEAARHLEYKNLWLTPHKVNLTFRWIPKT